MARRDPSAPGTQALPESERSPQGWLDRVFPVIEQVAALHERSRVHGRITPAVLDPDQDLTVRSIRHPRETWTQDPLGVDGAFVPPEVARGETPSFAADVWALGAVLAWSVVMPGAAPSSEVALRVEACLDVEAATARGLLAFVPLIHRALETRPEARFANARTLADAITEVAERAHLTVRRPTPRPSRGADSVDANATPEQWYGAPSALRAFGDAGGASSLRAGAVLAGRFAVKRRLGGGASGAVYEAWDEKSARAVALKVLHRGDASETYHLKREFRSLAEVAHTNLAALHELFQMPSGESFFTMELVDGVPFVDFVRGCRNDRVAFGDVLAQLVSGVRHLHAEGRVHRDLKPSNVLVTPEGRVVIVDFGLTELPSAVSASEHAFAGTPAYAAPEQVDPRRVGPASDWYAVGVMLYEALAGRLPFEGLPYQMLESKTRELPSFDVLTASGVTPALRDLCRALLAVEPRERASGDDVLSYLGHPSLALPRPTSDVPFVGRKAELERLWAAFERSRGREPRAVQVVHVRADSGMGKTTLLRHFQAELSERGAVVLSGRCHANESVPYKAIDGLADCLVSHLRELPQRELDSLLPADAHLLSRLFPVFCRLPSFPALLPDQVVDAGRRVRAFVAFRQLVMRLAATRPVVITVDDLQWSDADSLALLGELLERADPMPLLFVAAYRPREMHEGALPATLAAGKGVETFQLGPLSDEAVRHMIGSLLPSHRDETALQSIASAARGHPLFAAELAHGVSERGLQPNAQSSLEEAVFARLDALSPEARHALDVVSLAGRPLPRELVLEVSPDVDVAALRELRLSRALRETVENGVFHLEPYHDRIAELVRQRQSPETRRALYSRLADAALARGDEWLEVTVDALLRASRWSEVAPLADRAARLATETLAFEKAIQMHELLLSLARDGGERRERTLALADACVRAGHSLSAASHFEVASTLGNVEDAFELRRRAMVHYLTGGDRDHGIALFLELAAQVGTRLEPESRSALDDARFALGMRYLWKEFPRAKAVDARSSKDRERLRLVWTAMLPLIRIDPRISGRFVLEALSLASRLGDEQVYAQAIAAYASSIPVALSRPVAFAERLTERALAVVEARGDSDSRVFVRLMRGTASFYSMQLGRALDDFLPVANAPSVETELGNALRAYARSAVLPALYYTGQLARAAELAERWIAEAHVAGDRRTELGFRVVSASRFLRSGDVDKTLAELETAVAMADGHPHPALVDTWWHTDALLHDGRPRDALAVLQRGRALCAEASPLVAGSVNVWAFAIGVAAAACAAEGIDVHGSVATLRRCMRDAWLSPSAVRKAVHHQLKGTLAWLDGEHDDARELVVSARDENVRHGLVLRAAALDLALTGMGHTDAARLEANANAVFAAQGVTEPTRWARIYAGGLPLA